MSSYRVSRDLLKVETVKYSQYYRSNSTVVSGGLNNDGSGIDIHSKSKCNRSKKLLKTMSSRWSSYFPSQLKRLCHFYICRYLILPTLVHLLQYVEDRTCAPCLSITGIIAEASILIEVGVSVKGKAKPN